MPSARNGLLVRGACRAALWMVAAGAYTGIGEVASAQVTPSAGGRLLSRANNPDLFSMLGTTYGSTTRATSRSRTCAAWR